MTTQLEELYLEAEADIKNNNYAEAFRKYETILYEEPGNGPTLNSLGWLYKTQIEDYAKAESYYQASIKNDPPYPHAYFNLATLLTDMERYEELIRLLQKCLTVPTIEKSWVFMKLGLKEELQLNFQKAIECFERAILLSLNDEKIKEYRQNIERCEQKLELSKNQKRWIEERRKN
jgi:tetratricopeptide (TPR) repeat protein